MFGYYFGKTRADFLILVIILQPRARFAFLKMDPDPGCKLNADPCGCGSETLYRGPKYPLDICSPHHQKLLCCDLVGKNENKRKKKTEQGNKRGKQTVKRRNSCIAGEEGETDISWRTKITVSDSLPTRVKKKNVIYGF
jgi:hypothetical protein